MEIVDFLLQRIAEDEAAAKQEDEDYADTTLLPTYDSEHQANWNTARVLAECAAKRAIIGDHELVAKMYLKDYCSTCADWENSELGEGPPGVEYPCPTVKALAAVYADHEDYDSGWAL